MLYPLPLHLVDSVGGSTGGDKFLFIWAMWWVPYSLFELGTNPFFTNMIFHPIGTDLYTTSLMIVPGILSYPFREIFGPIFTYNILLIIAFTISGWSAYVLAHYFTKDSISSIFAGFMFTFSTFHLIHATGHFHLVYLFSIPFFILYLFKLKNENKIKFGLLSGIFLILSTYTADLQFSFYLGIFTTFFLVYFLISDRKKILNKKFMLGFTIIPIIFIIGISPILMNLYDSGTISYESRKPSFGDPITYSMDFFSFFTPSPYNNLLGDSYKTNYSYFSGNPSESAGYLGFLAIGLAIYATIFLRKKTKFWLIGSVIFAILSLGPILHIMGNIHFIDYNLTPEGVIPLPAAIFYYIPLADLLRSPSRIIFLATLTMAVVSAYSFNSIRQKLNSSKLQISMIIVFFLIIFVEYSAIPFPIDTEHGIVPEFYSDLAEKDTKSGLLDIPFMPTQDWEHDYMYYSSIAEKPMVGGLVNRLDQNVFNIPFGIPIVSQTQSLLSNGPISYTGQFEHENVDNANLCSMSTYNVEYLIIHKQFLSTSTFEALTEYVDNLGLELTFSDEKISSYIVPDWSKCVVGYPGDGWVGDWISKNGDIVLYSPRETSVDITFQGSSYHKPNYIKIIYDEETLGEFDVSNKARSDHTITNLELKEGMNIIHIQSNGECFIPNEITNGEIADPRCLSIRLANIIISEIN